MKARESLAARLRSENGAVLVYVALAMIGLVAFSALSVDYGVMWSSRRQAQNAADAAAHAGAVSLAFDNPSDFERARAVAETVGETNTVFGGTLNIDRGAGQGDMRIQPWTSVSPMTAPPQSVRHRSPGAPAFARTCTATKATTRCRPSSADLRPDGARGPSHGNGADRQRQCERLPEALGGGGPMDGEREARLHQRQPVSAVSGSWQPNQTWNISQTFDRYAKTGSVYGIDASITAAGQTPDVYVLPSYDADGNPIVGTGSGFSLTNTDGTLRDYGQMLSLKISSGNALSRQGGSRRSTCPLRPAPEVAQTNTSATSRTVRA